MKRISVPLFLGLAAMCAQGAGFPLPVPPQEHKPWHPDPAIPTNIVSAAETLFEQGFPDPRGCEYRAIEVDAGWGAAGKDRLTTTHGWVLPAARGTNQFAICWNGLIYPVARVFGPADLHAEVTASNSPRSRIFGASAGWAVSEPNSVIYPNELSTGMLLLLRCGETNAPWLHRFPNYRIMLNGFRRGGNPVPDHDPYLEYAGDWAWAMFDRTIAAHQRGDESLALATAQSLAEAQPKIEAECARRGFARQPYYDLRHRGEEKPYLEFLGQLPQIIVDLERRTKEPPKINILDAGITNFPDQAQRIDTLIDDLDLFNACQWGHPGWGNFLAEDPMVSALIQEGDPAVEPLLHALEKDKRLTRSARGDDYSRTRTVIPVHDEAKTALCSILHASFSDEAEIRAYWDKYKGLKLPDRWYAILNDDNARNRWQEAAANIVQPANLARFPGGLSVEKRLRTNAPVVLLGESLRLKSQPSVTDLLVRRALEIPTNNVEVYDLSAACQMAEYLTRWDLPAALPVAKTLSKRARTVMKYSGQQLGCFVTQLSLARAQAGDPTAFDDYAAWIVTTSPGQFEQSTWECLEPFKKFPTNTVLQAAAETLFSPANPAWGSLPWQNNFGSSTVESELVTMPAYRRLLCRELDQTNACGTVTLERAGNIRYHLTNLNQSGSFGITMPEGSPAANGVTAEIRWCDWIAIALANDKNIAPFDPFAPLADRDLAIQRIKTQLQNNHK